MRVIGIHGREARAGTMKLKVKRTTVPFCTELTTRPPQQMKNLTLETDQKAASASILDFQRSAATDLSVNSEDSAKAKSPRQDPSPALSDLDRALVEAAEEMSFNWPEFLPVERIKTGIGEIALASLLSAGLVALGRFLFRSFAC